MMGRIRRAIYETGTTWSHPAPDFQSGITGAAPGMFGQGFRIVTAPDRCRPPAFAAHVLSTACVLHAAIRRPIHDLVIALDLKSNGSRCRIDAVMTFPSAFFGGGASPTSTITAFMGSSDKITPERLCPRLFVRSGRTLTGVPRRSATGFDVI